MSEKNHWPSTQLCMECQHGTFINDHDEEPSTYICAKSIKLTICATECEKQEPKKREERFLANDPIEW